jgi:dienelactone hydrolase
VSTDLLRTKARIYLAHGTEDSSVPVESHDALEAELRANGRDVTAERLAGLDHSFLHKKPDPRGSVELVGQPSGGSPDTVAKGARTEWSELGTATILRIDFRIFEM